MATKKANYSLSSFKIGDIAADGGMGTALEELGVVVRDTCVLTQADATVTEFNGEIEDDPYFQVSTPGKKTLTVDLFVNDGEQLERLFGGIYTPEVPANPGPAAPEKWEAPAQQVSIEASVELVHKNGAKIQVPRMQIDARFEWNFKHNALALIHVTGTLLQPTKANTPPFTYVGVMPS
jgi:hypothetical protein